MAKWEASNIVTKNAVSCSRIDQLITEDPEGAFYPGKVITFGPMAYPRLKHGAAVMPDGNVLITGGCGLENDYFQRLNTAEVFNPRTGRSSLVGSLTTRRTRNECITLDNGTVMVVGGCTWMLSALDTCEFYDPETKRFRLCTPRMHFPRSAPRIIKMSNGNILIAGHSPQPEIYSPSGASDGSFRITRNTMREAKGYFELTLLADDRILITGGEDMQGKVVNTAEIYNPDSDLITVINPMCQARKNHFSVLLPGGTVLIGGGTDASGAPSDTIEVFNPERGSFVMEQNRLWVPRAKPQATRLPDNNVLVSGDCEYLEVYVTPTKELKPVRQKVVKRTIDWAGKAHQLVMLHDNTVLLSGGVWDEKPVEIFVPEGVIPRYQQGSAFCAPLPGVHSSRSSVRIPGGRVFAILDDGTPVLMRPETDDWVKVTCHLVKPRTHAACANLRDGRIFIAGGVSIKDNTPVMECEIFDPEIGTFQTATSLKNPMLNPVAINLVDGRIMIMADGSAVEAYNGQNNTMVPMRSPFPEPVSDYGSSRLGNGTVLVSGGRNVSVTDHCLLIDPTNDCTNPAGNLQTGRAGHFQLTLRSGKVLIGGGYDATGKTVTTLEVYDTRKGSWSTVPTGLREPVVYGRAVQLGNGTVIIAGGKTSLRESKPSNAIQSIDIQQGFVTVLPVVKAQFNRTIMLLKDGRVLLAGGRDSKGRACSDVEIYQPGAIYSTMRVADMLYPRTHNIAYRFRGGPLKNKVLVTCGSKSKGLSGPEAEIYDPNTDTWRETGFLNQSKRLSCYWCRPDGKVMIFGGDGPFSLVKDVEVFDPVTETWSYGPDSLSQERGCPVSAELNNGLYLVIGTHPEKSDLFDATGKRVGSIGPYKYGRGLPGLVHWRGNGKPDEDVLLLIGGYHGPLHRVRWCEMYTAKTNAWRQVADMHFARGHLRKVCVITADNLVLVPGGWDDTNRPLDTAELYDRTTDTWTLVRDTMIEKRGGHITQLLPNGEYFLMGNGKGAEFYDHATGLFTWAGLVHGKNREQYAHTELSDGSFLYVGGARHIAEKFVP